MPTMIIFFAFLGILYILISGGIGMYFSAERGQPMLKGFLVGLFCPIIGHILLACQKTTDAEIAKEVRNRNLVGFSEYQKMAEHLKNNQTTNQKTKAQDH